MVKISGALLKSAGSGIGKTLSEILVCPISRQSLRHCEETGTLISDAIGVSFPETFDHDWFRINPFMSMPEMRYLLIVDGIPCLVPQDGKILEIEEEGRSDALKSGDLVHSFTNSKV